MAKALSPPLFESALVSRSRVALSSPVEGEKELPKELVVAPWGEFLTLDGTKLKVGSKTLAELEANQKKAGFEEVVLDFGHNSYSGKVDAEGSPLPVEEPIKVAAYGRLSVREKVGVVLTISHWTKEGAEHYAGGHYKDLSPTVFYYEDGEVFFIHSVALTRQGQVEGLHALSAASLLSAKDKFQNKKMDQEDKYKKLLLALLSLEEDASDEEIAAAMAAKAKKPSQEEAQPLAADAGNGNVVSKEEFRALSAQFEGLRKQTLIDQAGRDGKVIPLSATAVEAMSVKDLAETIDKLPAGEVPLSAKTPETLKEEPGKMELTDQQKQICKSLGVSEADFLKTLEG